MSESTVISGLFPLAFLGLYAWRGGVGTPGTLLYRFAEGSTVFLLGYAIAGALLATVGWFHHYLVGGILVAALGGVAAAGIFRAPGTARPLETAASSGYLAAAVMVWALVLVLSRIEYIEMYSDPGIYTNFAKNLVTEGGVRYQPPIPDMDMASDQAVTDREAFQSPLQFLPGINCTRPFGEDSCHYNFLPGWPSVLGLGASLFGMTHLHYIMVPVAVLAAFWFFWITRRWLGDRRASLASAAFCTLPVFVYFGKFPTTEIFLLLCVLFLVDAFRRESHNGPALVVFAFAALAVTHISIFLYLPILLAYGIHVALGRDRREVLTFTLICITYALSLPFVNHVSPVYVANIFKRTLGSGMPVSAEVFPYLLAVGVLGFCGSVLVTRRLLHARQT